MIVYFPTTNSSDTSPHPTFRSLYCLFYFVSNIQRRLAAQNQERRKSKVRFLRCSVDHPIMDISYIFNIRVKAFAKNSTGCVQILQQVLGLSALNAIVFSSIFLSCSYTFQSAYLELEQLQMCTFGPFFMLGDLTKQVTNYFVLILSKI